MSKTGIPLNADERKIFGRKVKTLRKEGTVPGNVFGKKTKSEAVQMNLKEFKLVYKEAGETGLVDLKIGKEKIKHVLIHGVSQNPITDVINHVDFMEVDLKQKVTAEVPVVLVGESPAEKQSLGTVVLQLNEIEVEALPTELPEKFEVDITGLTEVDQAIFVKDLNYDKNQVEIKDDLEAIVAKVEPPQKEEVVEAPAPVEGEVPAEGEAAPTAEGATPAPEGNSDQSA